ncbi:10100_t:CDS:2 [Acaulospora colombiana]|uniref:10100_t:CDS:1 n=1 Tax=Acaulospora colombiana TaxID=27376 RepID=A0ACA9L7V1_9GLOM|nr:10100_t:CDS:2 [Acaulospora colombiana]
MISRETLLNGSTLDILVPNGILNFTEEDAKLLFTSKARTQTFYDENLNFYLILSLPYGLNSFDKSVAKAFFQNLEVNVDASLVESVPPQSIYSLSLSRSSSSSTDTSPSTPGSPTFFSVIDKKSSKVPEGTLIHSTQFNTNQKDRHVTIVEHNNCWTGVIPMSLPIVFSKSRIACPMLALNATVTLQSIEIEEKMKREIDLYSTRYFGRNLLAGLDDGRSQFAININCSLQFLRTQHFIPDSDFEYEDAIFHTSPVNEPKRSRALPETSFAKRTCCKMLPVKTALNVRMRTTAISPLENSMMISISVENNNMDSKSSFLIESIKVNVSHGFVTRYELAQDEAIERFPLSLDSIDQVTFLYHITILEKPPLPKPSPPQYYPTPLPNSCASSRQGTPILMGEKIGNVESKWNCMLDLASFFKRDDSTIPTKTSPCGTASQRTLSLRSRYGSSQISSTGSSAFISTGITTPATTKSIYHAIMSGCAKRSTTGSTMCDNASVHSEIASNTNGILHGGRTPLTKRPMETNVDDGVILSLSASSKIAVGKVFSVRVFIVNKSKFTRKFTITVPDNKKRRNDAHNGATVRRNAKLPIEPFMDENEFLSRHLESEIPEAGIICLNNNIQIGPLRPSTCESVSLHFIAMKESLHPIELIQLIDAETGYITNLRNTLEILVPKTSNKRESNDAETIFKKHLII